jgi:hypothetical protein
MWHVAVHVLHIKLNQLHVCDCVCWCRTTRVGTERHLLCIEDPFELSHDLGRTVHAGQ